MKRALLLFLPLLFVSIVALAQKDPKIEWKATDYDFGDIKEDGPHMAYSFFFTNTGDAPLIISSVKTSCGCTVSEYTKEPIKSGKEGVVKATFDPMNRPGKFNKVVTVYANTKPDLHMLSIKGNVLPKKSTEADLFPMQIGNARVKINHIKMGEISHKSENDTTSFQLYNGGDKRMLISGVKSPPHIRFEYPKIINPGEKGTILVRYNAVKKEDLGFVHDEVEILTDDHQVPAKKFNILATIKTRVTEMNPEEIANAAKIYFEKVHHNFGNIPQNEAVKTQFELTNTGKSTLVIYKVKSSCGCTASHPAKDKLEPGESTTIDVTFNSTGLVGQQGKEITVFSNDPKNDQTTLYINATVSAVVKSKN